MRNREIDRRMSELRADLARCNREIAAIESAGQDDAPAFMVTLGVEDWRRERRVIEEELLRYGD